MTMRMNEKKIILVCTLGKSPQVCVQIVWALANQMEMVIPDGIVAISMNNFAMDVKDSVFGNKLRKLYRANRGFAHN